MKRRTISLTFILLSIATTLVMSSVAVSITSRPAYAALLEKNTLTDQEKLGDLLLPNETDNVQTSKPGEPDQPEIQIQNETLDTTKSDLITQQQAGPVLQDIRDRALVDRIFPKIVEKLDGATILKKVNGKQLLEKLNGQQLLEKLDGNQLLEKVLPFMKITVKPITQPNPTRVSFSCPPVGQCGAENANSVANCGPEDGVAVGGTIDFSKAEGDVDLSTALTSNDGFIVTGLFDTDGSVKATVLCMKIDSTGIPAPGGGPLVPPSNDHTG
jgi:hypothetical protein